MSVVYPVGLPTHHDEIESSDAKAEQTTFVIFIRDKSIRVIGPVLLLIDVFNIGKLDYMDNARLLPSFETNRPPFRHNFVGPH